MNLPVPFTSFIGRERDLVEVNQRLFNSRLVTLTGPGGSGKTRLAIQAAEAMKDRFPGGAWLVKLAQLRDPALVPQFIAQALGLREAQDQPVLEHLLDWVKNRQLLLVMDNCEHLVGACSQLAGQLLEHALELRILATSREPLGVAGEIVYPVRGLACPVPGAGSTRPQQVHFEVQDALGYDAVRLFVERARAISSDFSITPENFPAIAEVCRHLDGLPLALELASARTNLLTAQQIAARLDRHLDGSQSGRFTFLTSAQRTGFDPRHHTLRAAIDWSYDLLAPEEQTLLGRLAVFTAGCTLDTAEPVCAGEGIEPGHVLNLLSSLVDKSLVVAETQGRVQARYRLLETIREYAYEKLEQSGEAARLRDRQLDVFLARAEEAAPKLNQAYQQLWLNWLDSEHDNLRSALAWSLESGRIEAGLRIAVALVRFWEIRGYVQEGMAWFERLLPWVDEKIPLLVRANAFVFASFLAMFLDNLPAARAYGQEAVTIAEKADDENDPVFILALGGQESAARMTGDYQTAFDIGARAIQLLRDSHGPPLFLCMALLSQADTAVQLGEYDGARKMLEESLALARLDGDSFRTAHIFHILGNLARAEQDYTAAQAAYEKSAVLLREVGAQHDMASILCNLAHTCLLLGDGERAQRIFAESMAIQQAQQNGPGLKECLVGFAMVAVWGGMPAAAARLLSAVSAMGKRPSVYVWPSKPIEFEPTLGLARASLTPGEFQAEQAAGRAMTLEQAVDYAWSLPLPSAAGPAHDKRPGGLSERECEVAALIGMGKTNGEIAQALVLSKRTVEKHAANIQSKLELNSRSQVMRWAIDTILLGAPDQPVRSLSPQRELFKNRLWVSPE